VEVASMIASFLKDGRLHALMQVKRAHVMRALCETSTPEGEGDGTYYVPSWAFDGRAEYAGAPVCVRCSAALCALAEAR
jgi:hypothetical protein